MTTPKSGRPCASEACLPLFTGFPKAFAGLSTALNIPLTLMLIGIVLRGSAFIFWKYVPAGPARHRWTLFGAASFFNPFVQGAILGALSTGQIKFAESRLLNGYFAGWLSFRARLRAFCARTFCLFRIFKSDTGAVSADGSDEADS